MKAVVMAGGEGSRLRPLTITRPKPMVPVVNKPIMSHILELLKAHGITDIVVTLQYLPDQIQDFYGNGASLGMNIQYSVEEAPLGTAGSVKHAQALLAAREPFLVISGDALTDFHLNEVVEFHRRKGAKATITLYHVPNPLEYGVVITDGEGRIVQFLEKPSWSEVISDTVNTGIYVLDPSVLEDIPNDRPFDFSKDLFPLMLSRGDPLYGYIASGYWCDVGNLTEYVRACSDLLSGKVRLGELGTHIGGGIWTGEGVEIAPDAQLYGPIYLGPEVKIKGGVVIHGPTAIRDYTVVDNRVHVDRSFIWRNCYIGEGAELRGAVVARQSTLKAKTVVFEGVVIGDNCMVGEGAVIHAGVKLWPGKEVEPGATVRSSIIWGSQGRRVLFGRFGVTGVVNVDLTPEFCAKLGAAFGATLPRGSYVTINRDPHRSPRMLKRAIIAGLPSAGVNVWDLRSQPIPVARYYTRVSGAVAGVHVRLSPYDQRVVDIRFMDKNGLNLSKDAERNVERTYFREDFRRAYLSDIGTIDYAPQVEERYTEGFLAAVDAEVIRNAGFRIVVDYAHAPSSQVLAPILEQLGVDAVPLNARIHPDKMAVLPEEFSAGLRQMATIVQALGRDLGVQLDVGGEKIFVADERGTVLPDRVTAAAMAAMALQAHGGGTIVVPVDQSQIFEALAARYQGRIIRCRVDIASLMQAAGRKGVLMALDGTGNYIFPAFHPAPDGLMATAKLLEFLARRQAPLSKVVAELPPFYISHGRVSCPWEEKGRVMRLLNEQYKNYHADTTDGIKIFLSDAEWVLILPDPDKPFFHITAESVSASAARELVDKYTRVVEGLQG